MNKEQRLKFHEMQANWWMHSASNGYCEQREVFTGDRKLSAKELRNDAMETALRHIHLFKEVAE